MKYQITQSIYKINDAIINLFPKHISNDSISHLIDYLGVLNVFSNINQKSIYLNIIEELNFLNKEYLNLFCYFSSDEDLKFKREALFNFVNQDEVYFDNEEYYHSFLPIQSSYFNILKGRDLLISKFVTDFDFLDDNLKELTLKMAEFIVFVIISYNEKPLLIEKYFQKNYNSKREELEESFFKEFRIYFHNKIKKIADSGLFNFHLNSGVFYDIPKNEELDLFYKELKFDLYSKKETPFFLMLFSKKEIDLFIDEFSSKFNHGNNRDYILYMLYFYLKSGFTLD